MATWIAHLRIAENLLAHIPHLDAGQFAVGNIAPDAGIPDKNWEKFDPPPQVTHFKRSSSVHKDIADLDFFRQYLQDVDASQQPQRFAFRLGYFFHLVTDNLWTIAIGKPTTEKFSKEFDADKNFIWEVKKDWYGLDHIYVRANPDCIFWRVFLDLEPDPTDLDFFPPEAISRHVNYVKAYYQRRDDNINEMCARPFIYLSQQDMDSFIATASLRLEQIYNTLYSSPPALDGLCSALELRK